MERTAVYTRIGSLGVIPVIAIDNVEAALPLADSLLEGGLPVAEITFRTAAAPAVIEMIAKHRPGILLGAGTLVNVEDLRRAEECGAVFGVAPGFNPEIARLALEMGFPFSPGVMTPSEIEGAISLGIQVLKFFPAGAAGGVKMLSSISAPYMHLGVKFIPTGGVNLDNMQQYLQERSVLAVGGTRIATRDDVAAGQWSTIRDKCRSTVAVVEETRATVQAAH